MREIIWTSKVVLNEGLRPVPDWVLVVTVVQWTLNAAHHERLTTSPYKLKVGREPLSECAALVEGDVNEWQADSLSDMHARSGMRYACTIWFRG